MDESARRCPPPPPNKHRGRGLHHREPEKNRTHDISIVQAERKGCTAVITFGGEEGNTVRGCLGYLIACAFMCERMPGCVRYICVCVFPRPPHSHLHKPNNHWSDSQGWIKAPIFSAKSHKAYGLSEALITDGFVIEMNSSLIIPLWTHDLALLPSDVIVRSDLWNWVVITVQLRKLEMNNQSMEDKYVCWELHPHSDLSHHTCWLFGPCMLSRKPWRTKSSMWHIFTTTFTFLFFPLVVGDSWLFHNASFHWLLSVQ